MSPNEADDGFRAFAEAAITRLRPLARATARDPHRADDLVQTTLEKLYVAWPRIGRTVDDPMAYARTVLVRSLLADQRRLRWFREVLVDDHEHAETSDHGDIVATRVSLMAALAELPPRQRMAVVLRHLEGLPVEDVAAAMDCSGGTVKSTTSAGLTTLRRLLGDLTPNGVN
jgi:RNA polymerase sigma-70 factor (sigma-E family)